jgi:hypothetical protein
MLITTIPKDNLVKVCGQWKQGDSLQKLISGQLYGSIDYVDLDDADYPMLITSTSYVLSSFVLFRRTGFNAWYAKPKDALKISLYGRIQLFIKYYIGGPLRNFRRWRHSLPRLA